MPDEHLVVDAQAFTRSCIGTDLRPGLDLDKGAELCLVPDRAAVENDEIRTEDPHVTIGIALFPNSKHRGLPGPPPRRELLRTKIADADDASGWVGDKIAYEVRPPITISNDAHTNVAILPDLSSILLCLSPGCGSWRHRHQHQGDQVVAFAAPHHVSILGHHSIR